MFDFCQERKFLIAPFSVSGKSFLIIEELLSNDETVLFCCPPVSYEHIEKDERQSSCVCVVTDKRLIIARKNVMGDFSKTLFLEQIVDITASVGTLSMGDVTIYTTFESFTLAFKGNDTHTVKNEIYNIRQSLKASAQALIQEPLAPAPSVPQEPARNPLDDIRQLKELLDMGALTQDEFDAKKKELLNL